MNWEQIAEQAEKILARLETMPDCKTWPHNPPWCGCPA